MSNIQDICKFIAGRWQDTVRSDTTGQGKNLALPAPFTVPCAQDFFQTLFYWDTYFACRGMAVQSMPEQVKNNCLNFIHLINTLGYVPNAANKDLLNRSQPPFFGALAALVAELYPDDRNLLVGIAAALEKEIYFWEHQRMDEKTGLFHYDTMATEEELIATYPLPVGRLNYPENAEKESMIAASYEALAEAESGWDFNPRFERRCPEYAPIDLNSLLALDYKFVVELNIKIGYPEKNPPFIENGAKHREAMQKMWNPERGAYMDFDMVNMRHSPVLSAASLFPLWAKIATEEEAASTIRAAETYLEADFGICCCEKNISDIVYQWNYPNVWAPMQLIAFEAADAYGDKAAARRWAEKYLRLVQKNFDKTGDLWEKYNGVTGTLETVNEYGLPRMMGWTAGVFVCAAKYLSGK